jgi:hypothetical protein
MSTSETFWWGCLGGFCGYLAAFVLPWLKDLWEHSDQEIKITTTRLILFACISGSRRDRMCVMLRC